MPVAVAVERVIGGKEDVSTVGNSQCVENLKGSPVSITITTNCHLCASINPDVNIIVEALPVRVEVVVSDARSKTILFVIMFLLLLLLIKRRHV